MRRPLELDLRMAVDADTPPTVIGDIATVGIGDTAICTAMDTVMDIDEAGDTAMSTDIATDRAR